MLHTLPRRCSRVNGAYRRAHAGQSGNPGGRRKGIAERVQTVVGDDGAKLIQAL